MRDGVAGAIASGAAASRRRDVIILFGDNLYDSRWKMIAARGEEFVTTKRDVEGEYDRLSVGKWERSDCRRLPAFAGLWVMSRSKAVRLTGTSLVDYLPKTIVDVDYDWVDVGTPERYIECRKYS